MVCMIAYLMTGGNASVSSWVDLDPGGHRKERRSELFAFENIEDKVDVPRVVAIIKSQRNLLLLWWSGAIDAF